MKTQNKAICNIKNIKYIYIDTIVKAVIYTYPDNRRFTGIAKCNIEEGDNFNKEYGEKLALARALDKVYAYNDTIYCAQIEDLHSNYTEQMKKISTKMIKNCSATREKADLLYKELTESTKESEEN